MSGSLSARAAEQRERRVVSSRATLRLLGLAHCEVARPHFVEKSEADQSANSAAQDVQIGSVEKPKKAYVISI